MLAVLAETPWDGALAAVLAPRDSLYGLLRVPMPAVRMGCSAEDEALAAGVAAAADAPDAENFDSYGALARDAGY